LAIPSHQLPGVTQTLLRSASQIDEAGILSTCNRVEFYLATSKPADTFEALLSFLGHYSRLPEALLRAHLYQCLGMEAARHLCAVTAGLDSMILGESEITAQVKHAYLHAQTIGSTGPQLNRLFQKALHCAKMVRSHTSITEGSASVGSVVVDLTHGLFGDGLTHCDVLLWGAGKAAEATARHLIKRGIRQLWIVNRTPAKAQDLAALCQGGWLSWEEAVKHLAHVDIAIVCTQAPHYVIDADDIETIRASRNGRPLVLIDLAVPRNIDPAVAKTSGVRLYNIDDLQGIACLALAQRRGALTGCEAIIEQQVEHLAHWWKVTAHKEAAACRLVESCSSV